VEKGINFQNPNTTNAHQLSAHAANPSVELWIGITPGGQAEGVGEGGATDLVAADGGWGGGCRPVKNRSRRGGAFDCARRARWTPPGAGGRLRQARADDSVAADACAARVQTGGGGARAGLGHRRRVRDGIFSLARGGGTGHGARGWRMGCGGDKRSRGEWPVRAAYPAGWSRRTADAANGEEIGVGRRIGDYIGGFSGVRWVR
jgi:hypothetical protein